MSKRSPERLALNKYYTKFQEKYSFILYKISMKIIFYNTHSYGDIIFTRGIVNWIASHLPSEHNIFYYHTKDLRSIPMHKRIIEMKYTLSIDMKLYGVLRNDINIKHFIVQNDEILINTMMYASKAFNKRNNYDIFCPKHMNTESVKLKADEIVDFLNNTLKTNIPYPNELDLLPNRTDNSKNKNLLDEKISILNYSKKVLICNGDTFSGQSNNVDLYKMFLPVIEKRNDVLFLFTEKKNFDGFENVIFVDEICEKNTIGDIEYLSKFTHIIIGRSSGPSHACFNKENCYDDDKKIVELTTDYDRAFFHKKGKAEYFWSDDFSQTGLCNLLEALLV